MLPAMSCAPLSRQASRDCQRGGIDCYTRLNHDHLSRAGQAPTRLQARAGSAAVTSCLTQTPLQAFTDVLIFKTTEDHNRLCLRPTSYLPSQTPVVWAPRGACGGTAALRPAARCWALLVLPGPHPALGTGGGCHLPASPCATCSASSSVSPSLPALPVAALTGTVQFGLPRATGSAFPAPGALTGTQQLVLLPVQSSRVSGHVPGPAQNVGAAQNQPGPQLGEAREGRCSRTAQHSTALSAQLGLSLESLEDDISSPNNEIPLPRISCKCNTWQ